MLAVTAILTSSCPLLWNRVKAFIVIFEPHLEKRPDVTDTSEDVACFHNKMFSKYPLIHTDHMHTLTYIVVHKWQHSQTNTRKSRVIRQVLNGGVHIHAAVPCVGTLIDKASPLEATITLAFLPVRHTSRGQRTCVID